MTSLQRYLAEEIAAEHVEGMLTRREAVRRLALLGVGTAAAATLIGACGDRINNDQSMANTTSGPRSAGPVPAPSPPGTADAKPAEAITWDGRRGRLEGAWAEATEPRGGVLVVHENKGLNDWVRSVVGRFAGAGYSALAVDLLSELGGTGAFPDQARATAALSRMAPERLVGELKSGVAELQRRVPGRRVAAVGFCFGGGLVWELLASGAPELSAAVPFYGPLPDNPDFAGSTAAVLGIYAALDTRVTDFQQVAKTALDRAELTSELVVEPGADHAFFNDTGPRYDAGAAADAWRRVLDWFGRYLM